MREIGIDPLNGSRAAQAKLFHNCPLCNATGGASFVWSRPLPSHDGERRSGRREHIHAGPTRDELIVSYRRAHFLPNNGLKAGEGSAFEPICEMLGH